MAWLVGVLIYLSLAIMVGLIGRTKSMGFWGFFLISVIFTPVTGFLLAVFFEIAALVTENRAKKLSPK